MEPKEFLAVTFWLMIYFTIKIGFVGMAIIIKQAKHEFIERAAVHYEKKPNRLMFMLGLANGIIIPVIGILLLNTQVLALVGILLLLFYLWLALLSYTVIYRGFASRLFSEDDVNVDAKQTFLGGLVAESAFVTPILGQAYSLFLFVRGLGAVFMAFMTRKPMN